MSRGMRSGSDGLLVVVVIRQFEPTESFLSGALSENEKCAGEGRDNHLDQKN